MRTAQELTVAVHARMADLCHQRERRRAALTGAVSGALGVALVFAINDMGGLQHNAVTAGYEGASLLSDSVGGYVLAAVGAFMVGVVVTVLCIRSRNK